MDYSNSDVIIITFVLYWECTVISQWLSLVKMKKWYLMFSGILNWTFRPIYDDDAVSPFWVAV